MKNIFKNDQLYKLFKEKGYIVIDLLSPSEVKQLQDIYLKFSIPQPQHFYSTSFLQDDKSRKQISEELQAIIRPKANSIFQNYKELGSVFLIKPSGENSQMPIHQDWTVVNEPEHHSITAWIPLVDTTKENGAITVLPKSHRLSTGLRSPSLQDPLEEIKTIAAPMMQTLEMKAGQAFIFSHALLHASHSNLSGKNRIAVAYGVIHQDTELIYYHKPSATEKIQKLSIPKDFFITYPEPGKQPANSILIEEIDYSENKVSIEDFEKFYNIAPTTFWGEIKKSLKNWINK